MLFFLARDNKNTHELRYSRSRSHFRFVHIRNGASSIRERSVHIVDVVAFIHSVGARKRGYFLLLHR